ncbi:MAG: argininosuccinate lyase, partial [Leptonema sp. (in: Bacteria)]|nr:argininosuccinate lyase [Leptonema sp. (in: bacteria)]
GILFGMIFEALSSIVQQFVVHADRIQKSLKRGFATATDLADALVINKGIPFREAHHIAGRLVALCSNQGISLEQASESLRSSVNEVLVDSVFYQKAINETISVERKVSRGGTAKKRVVEQIEIAKSDLKKVQQRPIVAPTLEF